QNIPGPTKAFEAPGVNDLWIAEFSPGPFRASRVIDGKACKIGEGKDGGWILRLKLQPQERWERFDRVTV
ncbi:MAG: hypothetical protein DMF06_11835, partial [Verrucomicrobia bacterium]